MRIQQQDFVARPARGRDLRRLHRVEQRIQHVQRDDHDDLRARIGALQLPRHRRRVRRHFLGASLRIDAIRFHIFVDADSARRVRVRVDVGKMRTLGGVGLQKNDLRADFFGGAQRLNESVAGFDGDIDRLLAILVRAAVRRTARAFFAVTQNHRHLRQASESLAIEVRQKSGSSTATTSGFSARSRRRSPTANSRRPGTTGK